MVSQLAASGNYNYGWFGGGTRASGIISSTLDRIDYNNDSLNANARGPLSLERKAGAATGGFPG